MELQQRAMAAAKRAADLAAAGCPALDQLRARGTKPGCRIDPDLAIVDLVADGDVAGALRCLMRKHGTSVYRYCREALRDPVLAEVIHRQVFLEVFHDLKAFRGDCTVRTWLFTITQHRVLDTAKGRPRAPSRMEERRVPCPRLSPVQQPDRAWFHQTLGEDLDRLSTHALVAALLRFQQGFTFEDMAIICNASPATLEARVMRTVDMLRDSTERRIEDVLAWLGAEHEPPSGWEARVLAATDVTRHKRCHSYAIPAIVIAMAA